MPLPPERSSFTPADHMLIVTDRYGKTVRGRVVYFEKIDGLHADVHILARDWLEPYRTPAFYQTPKQTTRGHYLPYKYRLEGDDYLFMGMFDRDAVEGQG